MLNNVNTNVERIIAKIDNDFNPGDSDWIPRIGAWVIDAMSQVKALRTVRKKVQLPVCNGVAYSQYPIDSPNLKVYNCDGCEIKRNRGGSNCGCASSTGKGVQPGTIPPKTAQSIVNPCPANAPASVRSLTDNLHRYNQPVVNSYSNKESGNFVVIDDNKIELNFDTNYVVVETDGVQTYFSSKFNCEFPVIPNVGKLIEGITMYCLYKMLTRGYKHPVMTLGASQYGTNPFYEWDSNKEEIARAVIIHEQGNIIENDGDLFQSAFFIATFQRGQ